MKLFKFLLIVSILKLTILGLKMNKISRKEYSYSSFQPINNNDMSLADESGILLESTYQDSRYACFSRCSSNPMCLLISFKSNQCKLFREIRHSLNLISTEPCLFKKIVFDYDSANSYLTNHWPFNNDLNDRISGSKMFGGNGYGFSTDRVNSKLSALSLNRSFLQAPNGIYFNGDFTITVWVKPIEVSNFARVLDFGGGAGIENVILAFSTSSLTPYICSCAPGCSNLVASKTLKMNKWYHLAYTMNGTSAILYVDNEIWIQSTGSRPRSFSRTHNFIGKSNWASNAQFVTAFYDDLRIFNKSLSRAEITSIMNTFY